MSRSQKLCWPVVAIAAVLLATAPADAKKSRPKPAPPATAPAETVAPLPPAVSADAYKADTLARISAALNAVTTLRAEFVQVDPRGVSSGRFYLARPGRLRFEYDPPSPTLVIADGKRVTVRDLKMKTDYRAKIGETPLRLLLKADVDLATDANITAVEHDGDQLAITAMETKGYGQGQITFIFKDPGLELQRWIVLDPTGAQTTVTLSGIEKGNTLEASLFELPRQASFESND
jgi:outer membrane lipoprotein-sorting protein